MLYPAVGAFLVYVSFSFNKDYLFEVSKEKILNIYFIEKYGWI